MNSTVIGVLGVSGYIIYLVTYYSQRDGKLIESTELAYIFEPLNKFLPSIVITALNFLVPKLFRKFVTWLVVQLYLPVSTTFTVFFVYFLKGTIQCHVRTQSHINSNCASSPVISTYSDWNTRGQHWSPAPVLGNSCWTTIVSTMRF